MAARRTAAVGRPPSPATGISLSVARPPSVVTTLLGTRQNEESAGKCRANLRSVRAVTRAGADDPAAVERATNQSRNNHEDRSRGDATRAREVVAEAPRWPWAIGVLQQQ